MSILNEVIQFYKDKKLEEKQRKQLINAKTDFNLLEKLIVQCNNNPNLKVVVKLQDGTRLELTTYEPRKTKDYELFNGDYYEVQ